MFRAIRPLFLAIFVLFICGTALFAVGQKKGAAHGGDLRPEYVQYFAALQENQVKGNPTIFVGVIEDLGRPPMGCTSAASQFVTFRVERVLLGAWTYPTIKTGYVNCGPQPLPSPPFTKGAKWIVFRPGLYFGPPSFYGTDIGYGMFAPTEANIAVVLKATEHGAGLSRDFVQRFLARSKQSGVLFVGRMIHLGEPPRAWREAAVQWVDFKVDTPLWGKVPKNTIRIGYVNGTLQPLPSPPFKKDPLTGLIMQWIVFAESEGNSFHAYMDVAQPELRYALFPSTNYNMHLVDDLLAEVNKEQRPATSLAQQVSYLDRDYHPASERSYAVKRVIQYESAHYNTAILMDNHGKVFPAPDVVYVCSVRDYYPSGERALVAEATSPYKDCDLWSFKGKVIYYFPSGRIRKTEFYQHRVLQGDAITYAEDGRILTKEHYEGGINDTKYAVAANHPLVGKWKSYDSFCFEHRVYFKTCVQSSLLWTFSSNGILDSQFRGQVQDDNWKDQTNPAPVYLRLFFNWKHTSTGPATGVLEEFQGGALHQREDIRWMSRNEFEATISFSTDPDSVGHRTRFVRDRSDGVR